MKQQAPTLRLVRAFRKEKMKRKLTIAVVGVLGGLLLFAGPANADGHDPDAAAAAVQAVMDNLWAVSYTHLTLPTTPYV